MKSNFFNDITKNLKTRIKQKVRKQTLTQNKNAIIEKLAIGSSLIMLLGFGSTSYATEVLENKVVDVTPPVGRIKIIGATLVDNINYVERTEIEVQVYAADDICEKTDIKYYISTTPISNTEAIEDNLWESYTVGATKKITLPSTTSTNKIYAIFKDATGNTSLIYDGEDTQYTIQYNANVQGEEITIPTGVGITGYYGMPFTVTTQAPKREGYYFLGWSTNPSATAASYRPGSIIPADVFTGTDKTITLYAIWTTEESGLPLLADVVNIGDYVNYPVYYDNVQSCNYNGWRVISKDVDLDGNVSLGTVNLVSAGVPLTFYNHNYGPTTVIALTTNFLTTPFNPTANYNYRKTGFLAYLTMAEVFTNEFTEMDGTNPKVRSLNGEDILQVTGLTEMATAMTMGLNNAKYQNLFTSGYGEYFVASVAGDNGIWYVRQDGYVYSNIPFYSEKGVRPVVSLKSTVKATSQDMIGAWNIEI